MKKLLATWATLTLAAAAVAAPSLNPANGHYYDYVPAPVGSAGFTFAEALANAGTMTVAGWTGYMATVTDSSEQAFITTITRERALIAATDAATEGTFRWVAGPEAGTVLSYSNWSSGEPNDYGSGEDEAVINWGADGSWNDIGNPSNYGYIVEFSAPTNVPEPDSITLTLLALAGVVGARRRAK